MPYTMQINKRESSKKEKSLYVSKELLKQLKLTELELIQVQFGTKEVSCAIYSSDNLSFQECEFSEIAWNQLYFPYSLKLTLEYDGEGKIYFGPLIGIFTAGFTGSILRPAGERSFLFAKYIHAASLTGALAVIFGSHHIDWEEGTMEAYSFTKAGWKKIIVPLPNVIYDRLPNRRTEAHPDYIHVREKFKQEYDIPWFNPGFFDKSEIHKRLVEVEEANRHLPKTIASPTTEEIKGFIHEYKHVYIKPKNGSLGFGIHQIHFDEGEGFYYCRFRDKVRNRLRRYSSLNRLLKTQFPTGFDHLVVQKGIALLKYQSNPIDFRIHTNKDEQGVWRISAIAAKIAGPGSVTTHVKSGGHIKSVQEIWEDLNLDKSLLGELKKTALLLSKAIDKTTNGNVGEIGFDLGIDLDEQIWMFEANSKPGRTIFSHPKLKREDQLTRKMPMTYAAYLYQTVIQESSHITVST
ncbi:MAG: YheC/YheD family protein [Bacillus sp. (in: Bacteria)]|nr:YheC/YheD family protein [Bacillus sp. (in: firmicutes)]